MIHPIVDPTVAIRERNNTSPKLSTRIHPDRGRMIYAGIGRAVGSRIININTPK